MRASRLSPLRDNSRMIEQLIEQRIREAEQRGDFQNLPGAGAPLNLDDDTLIPQDVRAAYRILKNAGFVPQEIHDLRELRSLEALLANGEGDEAQVTARKRVEQLRIRLEKSGLAASLNTFAQYADRLEASLAERRRETR